MDSAGMRASSRRGPLFQTCPPVDHAAPQLFFRRFYRKGRQCRRFVRRRARTSAGHIRMGRTRALRAIDCSCTALTGQGAAAVNYSDSRHQRDSPVVYVTALWVVINSWDAGIVDSFWGLLRSVGRGFHILRRHETRKILVLVLVAVWGLRLSFYIFRRSFSRPEDPRYQSMRAECGTSFGG